MIEDQLILQINEKIDQGSLEETDVVKSEVHYYHSENTDPRYFLNQTDTFKNGTQRYTEDQLVFTTTFADEVDPSLDDPFTTMIETHSQNSDPTIFLLTTASGTII